MIADADDDEWSTCIGKLEVIRIVERRTCIDITDE
jgi:hypothetical protein